MYIGSGLNTVSSLYGQQKGKGISQSIFEASV